MPLLQKLFLQYKTGFVPSLGQTLGAFHKELTELTFATFSLYFSSNFFTNTILFLGGGG